MATWKVAPALAAGCAAILKPSEMASVYAFSLIYLFLVFIWFVMLYLIIFKLTGPVWSWRKCAERSVFLLVSLIF